MKPLYLLFCSLSLALGWAVLAPSAKADSSHARIVRLSLVQGTVRFTREFHKDSLADSKAAWEVAPLNLPIREGYAIATDENGRAEVEFENGAMAFLSPTSLIEFYDLSLEDGARVTRLILRQGSAIFYVHPAQDDYFSVTGGDFSVEANGRTRFRLDNFDDGSNLSVELGKVNVLHGKETKALDKGQSYSINVNEGGVPLISRAPDSDDFDKWVSGRIDSVATATTYSNQYVNSPDYTSGFADLYTYGSFYNVPGYGFGWQPYGVGMGWNPFLFGSWYSDPFFGWNFIGSAPWGWLPYHFGGWVFSPAYGWVWIPSGLGFGGPLYYRPVTAVWVHSGATTGLVPVHPGDGHSRTPLNLSHGVYAVQGNNVMQAATPAAGEKWSVAKNPPRNTIAPTSFAATTQPTRVSRTILAGTSGARPVTLSRDSSIVYDAGQHRFVNGNTSAKISPDAVKGSAGAAAAATNATNTGVVGGSNRTPRLPTASQGNVMPVRPHITPPTPPSPSYNSSHSTNTAVWNGHANSGGSSASSHSSAPASVPAAAPAPSHSSGGGHH